MVFRPRLLLSRYIRRLQENEISLSAQGFSLKEIWDGFIEQIALTENVSDSLTIDQRLGLQERIVRLKNLIQRTEAAIWREKQPKKRFILHQNLLRYKKELEDLKLGKS